MKTILLLLGVLVLALSCDNDNSLAPEIYKPPEMFPLAEGAKWEYRYLYHYHEYFDYVTPIINIDNVLTGKYTLTVEEQRIFADSILYKLNALTEPDTGSGGGLESWEVMLHNDTLWYKQDSTWAYMMPSAFTVGGHVDILLFLPPIGRRYDLVKDTNYSYHKDFVNNGQHYYRYGKVLSGGTTSTIEINNKGMDSIDLIWSGGSLYYHPQWMIKKVWLAVYTSGAP